MSVVDIEPIDLDTAIDEARHAKLRARLEGLRDALEDAPDHYSADVKITERLVFVSISSSQHWTRKGELGIDRFRVTFGPRGGLETAEHRDTFAHYEIDYSDGRRVRLALDRLHDAIRDAS